MEGDLTFVPCYWQSFTQLSSPTVASTALMLGHEDEACFPTTVKQDNSNLDEKKKEINPKDVKS